MELKYKEGEENFLLAIGITKEKGDAIGSMMSDIIVEAATKVITGKGEGDSVFRKGDVIRDIVQKCDTLEEVVFAAFSLHALLKSTEEMLDMATTLGVNKVLVISKKDV